MIYTSEPKKPLKVVERIPGEGTGETVYCTEDGQMWKNGTPDYSQTCPARGGQLVNGYIFQD